MPVPIIDTDRIVITASRAPESEARTAASVTIIDRQLIVRLDEPVISALLRLNSFGGDRDVRTRRLAHRNPHPRRGGQSYLAVRSRRGSGSAASWSPRSRRRRRCPGPAPVQVEWPARPAPTHPGARRRRSRRPASPAAGATGGRLHGRPRASRRRGPCPGPSEDLRRARPRQEADLGQLLVVGRRRPDVDRRHRPGDPHPALARRDEAIDVEPEAIAGRLEPGGREDRRAGDVGPGGAEGRGRGGLGRRQGRSRQGHAADDPDEDRPGDGRGLRQLDDPAASPARRPRGCCPGRSTVKPR